MKSRKTPTNKGFSFSFVGWKCFDETLKIVGKLKFFENSEKAL